MAENIPVKSNFVLIGHVDHGKSTCAGRILVDTEMVSEKEIRRAIQDAEDNGMKSWWLAYLLDENIEERVKGKTHEYIVKPIIRKNHIINMIDVPGHNQFISQMIYGTSQADIVVLICSIKTGELEKGLRGQIYEHLILSRCIGITNLIVAINKIDTIGWNEDENALNVFNESKNKISKIIKKLQFKNVTFIPISAYHGWNVVKPLEGYSSLLDTVERIDVTQKITHNENDYKDLSRFEAKCIFMNIKSLITGGFTAVLHSGKTIVNCTITNIVTKYCKPFVTNKDTDYVNVSIELSEPCDLESYIIIRSSDSTIAIGRLLK